MLVGGSVLHHKNEHNGGRKDQRAGGENGPRCGSGSSALKRGEEADAEGPRTASRFSSVQKG